MTNQENKSHHSQRSHSKLSASGAARWIACPASVKFSAQFPDLPATKASIEGTHAHEYSEKLLVQKFAEYPGVAEYTAPDYPIEPLNDEMEEHIQDYVAFIEETVKGTDLKIVDVFLEKRFALDEKRNMYGTGDFFCVFETREKNKHLGLLIDLKYGERWVRGENNRQLGYYACGAVQTFPQYNFVGIQAIIFQPRCPDDNGICARGDFFDAKRLETLYWELLGYADRALEADITDRDNYSVDSHCTFCSGKVRCKAFQEKLQNDAKLDFNDIVVSEAQEPFSSDIITVPNLSTLTEIQLAAIVIHGDRIKKFVDSVAEHALALAKENRPLPGTKAVEKRRRRQWYGEKEQIAQGLIEFGVERPYDSKLRALTKIEKELGKDGKDILENFVRLSPVHHKIVSEKDKGKAVDFDMPDFDDFLDDHTTDI